MAKRFVVPIDGSPCAAHALRYATRLAKAEGAEIEFCTVVDRAAVPPDRVAAAQARARTDLNAAIAQAAADGLTATGDLEIGSPAAEIVSHAARAKAEAIIMGTHGRTGFKRLFMGSVAQEVLRSAPCPVMIVREKVSPQELEAGLPAIDPATPVYVLHLVEVTPADFERLYGEIATFLSGPGADIPGVVGTELFGSFDSRRIAILVQFHSQHDWARAQWDARMGEFLEEIAVNSQALDFGLYRGDRFAGTAPANCAVQEVV